MRNTNLYCKISIKKLKNQEMNSHLSNHRIEKKVHWTLLEISNNCFSSESI